jgi:hypothetical protein
MDEEIFHKWFQNREKSLPIMQQYHASGQGFCIGDSRISCPISFEVRIA